MMELNMWILPIAALVPTITGFIWYNPKVLGTAWMNAAGVTEEKLKSGNMALIIFLSYIFSTMIASVMLSATIHQMSIFSTLAGQEGFDVPGSDIALYLQDFMTNYGAEFRTFKHGAFHGFILGLFFAFPLISINALFERKSWKYIWIHTGYWLLTLSIMGGIVCQFA